MFKCDKCGLCCLHIGQCEMYKDLDRGDGACKFLNGTLCAIYESRPLLCRVDESYEKFFSDKMSRDEFYELNYQGCKTLKEKYLEV